MRNYATTDEEAPIYGIIKLSNIIYISLFWWIPAFLFWKSLDWWSLPMTIIYGIITLLLGFWWYVFSEWKRDWRNIVIYFLDSLRKKEKLTSEENYNIKKYDIQWLIESLKK